MHAVLNFLIFQFFNSLWFFLVRKKHVDTTHHRQKETDTIRDTDTDAKTEAVLKQQTGCFPYMHML